MLEGKPVRESLLEKIRILNEQMDGTLVMSKYGVFEYMIEHAPIGMFLCDHDGMFLFVNSLMEELTGYECAELVGSKVEMLVPEMLRKAHEKQRIDMVGKMSRRYLRVVQCETKKGYVVDIEVGLQPIVVNGGTRLIIGVAVPPGK